MLSNGCKRLIATPQKASTNCLSATRAICRTRRSLITPSQRCVQRLSQPGSQADEGYMLMELANVGIRRQPRHPLPGDISQERLKRRTSFPHHGATDQRADGYNHGEQQAHSPGGTRTGRTIRLGWRMLLDDSLWQWQGQRQSGGHGARYDRLVLHDGEQLVLVHIHVDTGTSQIMVRFGSVSWLFASGLEW